MQPPILKTYRPGTHLGENVFYIQSKGLHSGRPMHTPIANCFSAQCKSNFDLDFWHAVCTALWLSNRYRILIIGSVVPFIRIRETSQLLGSMRHLDTSLVQRTAKQLSLYTELQKLSTQRTFTIEQLRRATAAQLTSLL